MLRVVVEAVIAVLVITLLRAVIGAVMKGFSDLFHSPNNERQAGSENRPRPIPNAEALQKDPVCGTFMAPSGAVRKTVGNEIYYFCSNECRDKFREPVRKAG